jgi:hypothetical protein
MSIFKKDSTWDFNQALFIAGRMLLICQKFESTCKYSLSSLLPLLDEKEGFSLEEFIKKYTKNYRLFLRDLNNEAKKSILSKGIISGINAAIKSRNFICHEFLNEINYNSDTYFTKFCKKEKFKTKTDALAYSLEFGCPSFAKKEYKIDGVLLLEHAENIARGDFLVSKISYELSEKEPFLITEKRYISEIVNFILEGLEYKVTKTNKKSIK